MTHPIDDRSLPLIPAPLVSLAIDLKLVNTDADDSLGIHYLVDGHGERLINILRLYMVVFYLT